MPQKNMFSISLTVSVITINSFGRNLRRRFDFIKTFSHFPCLIIKADVNWVVIALLKRRNLHSVIRYQLVRFWTTLDNRKLSVLSGNPFDNWRLRWENLFKWISKVPLLFSVETFTKSVASPSTAINVITVFFY